MPGPLAPDGRGGPCPASKSYFRCTVQEIKHEKILAGRRLSLFPSSSLSLFFLALSLVLAQWVFNPMKHLRARECLRRRGRQWGEERKEGKAPSDKASIVPFHVQIAPRRCRIFVAVLPPSLPPRPSPPRATTRFSSRLCSRIRALD